METEDLIQKEREGKELDILLEKGMRFTVPKKSLLRIVGGKERSFYIYQPYLGTLDLLSREFLEMEISEEKLQKNPIQEAKSIALTSAKRCARIVAIAVLNNRTKVALFASILTWYFLWRITPTKLFQLTIIINKMNNYGDFINSIRYLSTTNRTTSPTLMEKRKVEPRV